MCKECEESTLSPEELNTVSGGAFVPQGECLFVPNIGVHFDYSDGEAYLMCNASPCRSSCSCYGSFRCVNGMHKMVDLGRKQYRPFPVNQNGHDKPEKLLHYMWSTK